MCQATHDYNFQIFIDFLFGGSSGMIIKSIFCTFEELQFLSLKRTLYEKQNSNSGLFDGCKQAIQDGSLFRQIRKNNKIVQYSLMQALNFSIYDALNRKLLPDINEKQKLFKYFSCTLLNGGIAGIISLSIFYPLNYSKVRLVNNILKASKEKQTFWYTLNDMYKGFGLSGICIFLYRGIYFGGYDTGQYLLWGQEASLRNQLSLSNFLLALFVVSLSQTLVHPLDTIRKDLILQNSSSLQIGFLDCVENIYKQEGLKGLFKGYFPVKIRHLGFASQLILYDKFQQLFNSKLYY
ncbi:unnamed protein product [Paramecium sonneborni]|uniref:ADP/ATP translocase n=1 Tax=Paramecium sonneborni TaxID=65129 RepID=A0A8S1KN14_9CILI|nr:unnamed protein product [Paramecium sonneborni]